MRFVKISRSYLKREPKGYGIFHQWGQEGDQDGTYPVGIIEDHEGRIDTVPADRLQFVGINKIKEEDPEMAKMLFEKAEQKEKNDNV